MSAGRLGGSCIEQGMIWDGELGLRAGRGGLSADEARKMVEGRKGAVTCPRLELYSI